jgi:predicted Zn-dependent protease with MMP-like domain
MSRCVTERQTLAPTLPPSLADIERLARAALAALPPPFDSHLKGVVLRVVDFADDATLAALEIDNPFDLSGLYEGHSTARSVEVSGNLPDTIWLYRRPILDEWADTGEALEDLVTHIVVHEVGHHFGLSDDDIDRIEAA